MSLKLIYYTLDYTNDTQAQLNIIKAFSPKGAALLRKKQKRMDSKSPQSPEYSLAVLDYKTMYGNCVHEFKQAIDSYCDMMINALILRAIIKSKRPVIVAAGLAHTEMVSWVLKNYFGYIIMKKTKISKNNLSKQAQILASRNIFKQHHKKLPKLPRVVTVHHRPTVPSPTNSFFNILPTSNKNLVFPSIKDAS